MDTVVVIMLKDKETGFLDKELASLSISKDEELIVNLFVEENDENKELHFKISTERDVQDWEYSAIFDYYDTDVFVDKIKSITEVEDYYNPTWELIFDYSDNILEMEEKVIEILNIHKKELEDVYNTIKDKESEYKQDEE